MHPTFSANYTAAQDKNVKALGFNIYTEGSKITRKIGQGQKFKLTELNGVASFLEYQCCAHRVRCPEYSKRRKADVTEAISLMLLRLSHV